MSWTWAYILSLIAVLVFTPSCRERTVGRLLAAVAGAIGVSSAVTAFNLMRDPHISDMGALVALYFLWLFAAVVGALCGALLSRWPGWPRVWVTYGLLVVPWLLPGVEFVRMRARDRAIARCEQFVGQPATLCQDAGCRPTSTCHEVAGAKGLCLVEPIRRGGWKREVQCRAREGVSCQEGPREICQIKPQQHCESDSDYGHICTWNGSQCVPIEPLCGGCVAIADRCSIR